MNKKQLANQVAELAEIKKGEAEAVVNAVFDVIADALSNGEEVSIHGFGKFEVRDTAARKGRNPQTGEEMDIPAGKKAAFKPASALKSKVKA